MVGQAGRNLGDWWVIGSTALRLHGVSVAEPEDVDLLGSSEVMLSFLEHWREMPTTSGEADAKFRSYPYQRVVREGQSDIELMGGLQVASDGRWMPMSLHTRIAVPVGDVTIHIPDLAELSALLHLFGRPKDLSKIELIRSQRGSVI